MKNFQVIGRCVETQTLSLEDELRLFDSVPYDIDFSREHPFKIWAGETLRDMPAADVMVAILSLPKVPALPAGTAQNCSEIDWDAIDKEMKKERKREKKWVKNHEKVSTQEAIKNFDNLMKEWGIHD